MKTLLYVLSVCLAAFALLIFMVASGAVHEILAAVLFLTAVVALSAGALLGGIKNIARPEVIVEERPRDSLARYRPTS